MIINKFYDSLVINYLHQIGATLFFEIVEIGLNNYSIFR